LTFRSPRFLASTSAAVAALAAAGILAGCTAAYVARVAPPSAPQPTAVERTATSEPPPAYDESVPAAAHSIRMVPVPGPGDRRGFWMSATEITWDAYDVYVFAPDGELPEDADAVTRPSKPYIPPDRGFGHAGYPAISITFEGAKGFCAWLSARTGRTYRLPAEDEWEHACRAGASTEFCYGDDPAGLEPYAWFWDNADDTTHPAGAKRPNRLGLHDMHGNVMEWCVGRDGEPVARGGSYRDDPEDVGCGARALQKPAWNMNDPQIPKSRWWLSDAPFVGFRIVRDFAPPQRNAATKNDPDDAR